MNRIVIVGASLAGVSAAEELRARGYTGEVTLIGAEAHLPYTRPPLSKDALFNGIDRDDLALREGAWYTERGIGLRLGAKVAVLDARSRQLRLEGGATLTYDGLVIATGLEHRPADLLTQLPSAHQLRTLDDAEHLATSLASATHLVVIGAGFIGLETAATARQLGIQVTVVDIAPQPMSRAFGPEIGSWFRRRHEEAGVRLITSMSVARAEEIGSYSVIHLDNGEVLVADACLVCTGSVPATSWLDGSGVALSDGVDCDATLTTNVPGIVAAGDVARWHNPLFGEDMRVVHWTNAVEQGVHAAATLLGEAAPFSSVPFFWTDQYEAKLRCVGRPGPGDDMYVLSQHDTSLVAVFGRNNLLSAAVCVNAPRAMAKLRKAIADRVPYQDLLSDATPEPGLAPATAQAKTPVTT